MFRLTTLLALSFAAVAAAGAADSKLDALSIALFQRHGQRDLDTQSSAFGASEDSENDTNVPSFVFPFASDPVQVYMMVGSNTQSVTESSAPTGCGSAAMETASTIGGGGDTNNPSPDNGCKMTNCDVAACFQTGGKCVEENGDCKLVAPQNVACNSCECVKK